MEPTLGAYYAALMLDHDSTNPIKCVALDWFCSRLHALRGAEVCRPKLCCCCFMTAGCRCQAHKAQLLSACARRCACIQYDVPASVVMSLHSLWCACPHCHAHSIFHNVQMNCQCQVPPTSWAVFDGLIAGFAVFERGKIVDWRKQRLQPRSKVQTCQIGAQSKSVYNFARIRAYRHLLFKTLLNIEACAVSFLPKCVNFLLVSGFIFGFWWHRIRPFVNFARGPSKKHLMNCKRLEQTEVIVALSVFGHLRAAWVTCDEQNLRCCFKTNRDAHKMQNKRKLASQQI